MSITLVLTLGVIALASLTLVWRTVSRPDTLLYLLALVVSLVGVNMHVGVTIYLSRILVVCFVLVLAIRHTLQMQGGPRLRCDARLIVLFGAMISVQAVSAFASERTADSLRQLFIYLGAMAIFVTVISLADTSAKVIRALRLYLVAGIAQGLYGMYQVVGGPRGWATYQSIPWAVPTANDRTSGGYYFTPGYDVFRAFGFFPGDVSHYAGYMAGVLLIAMGFLTYRGDVPVAVEI